MRLFLLESAKKGNVVRAIVCAPDASGSVESDRAINFMTPDGGKLVLRQAGESEFVVTEDQAACGADDLHASVVRETENSVSFEVVYSADSSEVPAFSFLDQNECVPAKKVLARITTSFEAKLGDVWSFQANLAMLREYEMRLRTESVTASLVQTPSELEANRYTDELSQVASSLELKPNLFLPLQSEISGSTVPCIVHLQGIDGPGNFAADIYWCETDSVTTGHVELKNVGDQPLLTATVL